MWWKFVCTEHPPPPCLWSSFLVWYSTKTTIKDKNTMKRKGKRDSPLPLSSSTPVGRLQLLINNEMIDFAINASVKETWKHSGLVIYYHLRNTEHLTCLQQFICKRMQCSKLVLWKGHHLSVEAGADPGFILGGGALVSSLALLQHQ